MSRLPYRLLLLIVVLTLGLPVAAAAAPAVQDGPSVPDAPSVQPMTPDAPAATTPTAVVTEPSASYHIADSKLWWHNFTAVACDPDLHTKTVRDIVRRIAPQGSTIRTIFNQQTTNTTCASQITSNVVANSTYVFWTTDTALVIMPIAETVTTPVILTPAIKGQTELAARGEDIYALNASGLWRIAPLGSAFTVTPLRTAAQVGANPHELRVDGYHVFWITNSQAKRFRLADNSQINIGPSGATALATSIELCLPPGCNGPDFVYVGVGREVRRYKTTDGGLDKTLYTSDSTKNHIGAMRMVALTVWFVDEQESACEPFCAYTSILKRVNITGNTPAEPLYISPPQVLVAGRAIDNLQLWKDYVYWQDNRTGLPYGSVARLPVDADALTLTNLRVTNVEITQGIQRLNNNVPVIRGKRTFVRVHVKSDGPDDVPGVTARLYRINSQSQAVMGDPLTPINSGGQYLTAKTAPDRAVMDDAFLFELPMDWIKGGINPFDNILTLRAELNPYKYPVQQSYTNNIKSEVKGLTASPSLSIRFVLFRYKVGDTLIEPRYEADFLNTLSYMRRTYPVATTSSWIGATGPGFHPGYTWIFDQDLRGYINRSECDSDDSLCASDYVHGLLEDWDDDWNFDYAPMYGMMRGYFSTADPSVYFFPRGSTSGDTSNGPAGQPGVEMGWTWDTDGSFADWYAAHEIGHVLDRDHPTPNGDPDTDDNTKVGCGHSQDDDDYPYAGARIGTTEPWGFDPGDSSRGIPMAILPPSNNWDFMSYCNNQWISDYTFNGLRDEISALAAAADAPEVLEVAPYAATPEQIEQADYTGDYWSVYGIINPADGESVKWVRVRHKNGTVDVPIRLRNTYLLRQVDAAGNVLGERPVLTTPTEDGGRLGFKELFPYTPGVRRLELVKATTGAVLATFNLSANPPTVSNVRLVGAPNPVDGVVTLAWDASDPDGNPLKFDIRYSRDNGANWQPLQANVTDKQTQVDTAVLGGSATARFEVTASDGAHTAVATSPLFTMASHKPIVTITNPGDGSVFQYGQLINFMGLADDPQGPIADNQLEWRSGRAVLGTGPFLSLASLSVGEHTLTLVATNPAGQTGTDTVTITIGDDLTQPGPTLAVGPATLGFQFSEGATQNQTGKIAVANLGSGALNWTASESAAWLTLSATSGQAPSSVTVTVNPNQVPPAAQTVVADITFKYGGQEQKVRVNASFGGAYVSTQDLPRRTLLPLLMR